MTTVTKMKRMEKIFKRQEPATAASIDAAARLGEGWVAMEPVKIAGVGWIPRVASTVYDICLWYSHSNDGWLFCGSKDNRGEPFDTTITVLFVESSDDAVDTFVSFKTMIKFIEKEFAAERMVENV